jgi:hypothetical protein
VRKLQDEQYHPVETEQQWRTGVQRLRALLQATQREFKNYKIMERKTKSRLVSSLMMRFKNFLENYRAMSFYPRGRKTDQEQSKSFLININLAARLVSASLSAFLRSSAVITVA